MSDYITVRGVLGTEVQRKRTKKGDAVAEFRLASSGDWLNRDTGEWVKGVTNWYTVQAFRGLAENLWRSLAKGDPVVVTGKLKLRQWELQDGRRGTSPEIDADSIGHDLRRGTAEFIKNWTAAPTGAAPDGTDAPHPRSLDCRSMALADPDPAVSVPDAEAGSPVAAVQPARAAAEEEAAGGDRESGADLPLAS
ncbi:single-stranded DNA-binding protein [Arthrobacter sp. CAU 1506]|uniref:single-stranded DNA-binding protein n=1 Tax=Arthrobacter sp. CAU 1506 TaxID=2560052 RepID=UPI0010AD5FD9|nr:single-stranded DNA-binding protein [Arthrobacter sp. CAU 1506]TJY67444.1 single-stranded DNA-binding protein [Arthrobacter sp. CAU 1506]